MSVKLLVCCYFLYLQNVGKLNMPFGEAILKGYGLFTERYWFWIGVGSLCGYTVLLNILLTLFLTYLNRRPHI